MRVPVYSPDLDCMSDILHGLLNSRNNLLSDTLQRQSGGTNLKLMIAYGNTRLSFLTQPPL
jgi:hypothetical protein